MKKLTCLLLVLLLIVPLAACQSTAPQTEEPAANTAEVEGPSAPEAEEPAGEEAPETEAPATDSAYANPVEVSISVLEAEKNGQTAKNEFIKNKFNLTFEYVPVSWGDWNEKVRTWIATDDAPNLINWDLKGASATEYRAWAQQGAFAPFKAEYFTDERPNLKNTFETADSVPALSVDGELYAWPSLRYAVEGSQSCYTSHWCYRRDWAQDVGLYKEGDIYTWDEWLDLIRAVLEKDPGGNGTANAGLVMPTWGFPHAPALFIGPPAAEGNETCSYIIVDGKYVWPPALEEYKKGVKITYDMYQEGLIYRDNMVFTGTENEDMVKTGLAFATYNVTGTLNDWTTTMMRDGVIDEREDFGIAIVSGWDGTWYMTQTEDYWTVTAMDHKLNDDPEKINRILDFWEYLQTTEGIRLRLWGIEGQDYTVVGEKPEDIELLWDFDEATQTYISPYQDTAFNEANGSCNGPDLKGPGTIEYQYEERDRLWQTFASGQIPTCVKTFDYNVSFGSAENKDKYGSFGTDVKTKLSELIAKPGIDVEAEWDAFVESMMPRVQLVLDELNTQFLPQE